MSRLKLYRGDETTEIAAIDFTPAWRSQGWETSPQPAQGLAVELPTVPNPPALDLINQASSPDALTPLPSIGVTRAGQILENRPAGGYKSLEQVAQLNPHGPDWDAVAAWGTDG